jgi:hypothetical protein
MYCPKCGKNDAFNATDVNMARLIIVCPDCKEVSWPMPTVEDLRKDVERIKERMKGIENMPELESEE